jgi:hypothetical protein
MLLHPVRRHRRHRPLINRSRPRLLAAIKPAFVEVDGVGWRIESPLHRPHRPPRPRHHQTLRLC